MSVGRGCRSALRCLVRAARRRGVGGRAADVIETVRAGAAKQIGQDFLAVRVQPLHRLHDRTVDFGRSRVARVGGPLSAGRGVDAGAPLAEAFRLDAASRRRGGHGQPASTAGRTAAVDRQQQDDDGRQPAADRDPDDQLHRGQPGRLAAVGNCGRRTARDDGSDGGGLVVACSQLDADDEGGVGGEPDDDVAALGRSQRQPHRHIAADLMMGDLLIEDVDLGSHQPLHRHSAVGRRLHHHLQTPVGWIDRRRRGRRNQVLALDGRGTGAAAAFEVSVGELVEHFADVGAVPPASRGVGCLERL